MNLLTLLGQSGWKPGIGDPTVMGWLTVLAYLLVALAGWHRARTVAPDAFPLQQRFWRRLTVIVLLLGVNKQLNFLTFFTSLGRSWAWQQQWYAQRQIVQLGLVGIVGLLLLAVAGVSLWRLRRWPKQYLLAQLLLLLLVGFVLVRATSLHAVDYYLYTPFAGIRLNWVVELGLLLGLLATAVSPLISASQPASTPNQAP